MTLTLGRVLRGADNLVPVESAPPPAPAQGRRVEKALVDAELRAKEILADAERRGAEIVRHAEATAADVKLRAHAEGRAEAAALVAARAVELSALEARTDQRALDRVVQIGAVLAERLLGEQLALEPSRVTALARQAIAEARGARAVKIVAHPEDVAELSRMLETLGLEPGAIRLEARGDLARGHLVLHTDIGVLDAELGPQLDRLARRLRESLGS